MNALSVSVSLSVKKNQCRKTSHTQSRSHTDFAPLIEGRCSYFGFPVIKKRIRE